MSHTNANVLAGALKGDGHEETRQIVKWREKVAELKRQQFVAFASTRTSEARQVPAVITRQ
jgi:hypothetical protein